MKTQVENILSKCNICLWIMAAGFILRLLFIIRMPYLAQIHDAGDFTGLTNPEIGNGHLAYIEYLFKYGHLPDFDPRTHWSFATPPGYHILAAFVLKIAYKVGLSQAACYESIQYLNLVLSAVAVFVIYKILREFIDDDFMLNILMALVSFFPFFTLFSWQCTNDMLCLLCMSLAFYFTICWEKNPTFKNILLIALSLGYAMFTKINSGMISLGIGTVFLIKLWQNRELWKKYIAQFAAFLAVCAPLGLFIPIKYYRGFNVPILFYQKLSPVTDRSQFLRDATLYDRIGPGFLRELFHPFYDMMPEYENNIWAQTLRTAIFDEIPVPRTPFFNRLGIFMIFLGLFILVALSIFAVLGIVKSRRLSVSQMALFILSFIACFGFYVRFCLTEPFICTMSFRYVAFTMVVILAGAGIFMSNLDKKSYLFKTVTASILVFAVASVVFTGALIYNGMV